MERHDTVWQNPKLVQTFLKGVRGGIPFEAEQLEIMLRILDARGAPLQHFADLGCGSGVLARTLLARYPGAQATLVDFSEPMLAAAREQLAEHKPAACFVTADLATPDWTHALAGQRPFDAVVSGYAIHHLPDTRKRALYAEIFSLLAPDGMFINVEHVASPTSRIEAMFDALAIDNLYAFHRRQGSTKTRAQVAEEYVHRPDKAANILAPVGRQCEWLRDCGFADVDCYFKVFELAVFGGRKPSKC